MSVAYEYRKVYADLITPEGGVAVFYLHYVNIAGGWSARANVEWTPPGGERQVFHGVDSPRPISADTPVPSLPTALELADGRRAELELSVVQGPWSPQDPPPMSALTWRVRAAKTRARLSWEDQRLEGWGYVDHVQINRPTRLVGLRRIAWGRVHFPRHTVVFEHLEGTDGALWDSGLCWHVGSPRPRALGQAVRVRGDGSGELPLAEGMMRFRPTRVLHDGDAFDPDRVPRRLDRLACQVIGGPTHEVRWLGEATLGDQTAPILYETVVFG